eukprot:tig00000248_g21827.t1
MADFDDDAELAAIRARRLAEMQAAAGGAPGMMPGMPGGGQDPAKAEEMRRQQEERRRMMLNQILTREASERLNRIRLVKEEKARAVEDLLLRAAQTGQLREKVDEPRLINMLEQINESTQKETKITIQRRRVDDDD